MSEKIDGEFFVSNEVSNEKYNPLFIALLSNFIANRDTDAFLKGVEGSKEIEASLVDFKQIKEIVKLPGTMTHITKPASVENWARLRAGEQTEFKPEFDETATSFNVTDLDGNNSSIEGSLEQSTQWMLKDHRGFQDKSLVVFSKKASEKITGRKYLSDSIFLVLQEQYPLGNDFFRVLDQDLNIKMQRSSGSVATLPQWESDIALYERISCILSDNELMAHKTMNRFSDRLKTIDQYVKKSGNDVGYRFRGIYETGDQKIWGDLSIEGSDISRIIIPVKPGENYLSLNYKDHPPLK